MSIKIKRDDWNNATFRDAILGVAQILQEDVEIEVKGSGKKQKFKPYNAQIWKDDDVILEKDFMKKYQALKWIKKVLVMKKYENAFADLKKYNTKNDDFDYWFFKVENNKVVETLDI